MDFLPIFLQLQHQPCLVVGGGSVAARKIEQLLACGARVTVLAPALDEVLQAQADAGQLTHRRETIDPAAPPALPADLRLVIAATDDETANAALADACRARGVLVNVVDRPALSSFITPAVIDRSPLVVAVSSGGAAPVLARRVRLQIEQALPPAIARLAALAGRHRARAQALLPSFRARLRFWERVFDGPIAADVLAGREVAATAALEQLLTAPETAAQANAGEVYLVGGGPGDPELLTLKALRLMQQADVVLYDRLVSPEVLAQVRRDAERIYVGKARDRHTLPQDQINARLVELARQGKRVLRLKGGDPFIFGRGGEEIDELMAAGVDFQVVPGITAASGCAAYAGIPLTHRDHAHTCVFVTGHLKDGTLELNWDVLIRPRQTVVIYMGLQALTPLCEGLIARGVPPDRPAAVVEQGTLPAQRVVTAPLAELPAAVAAAALAPPSLIIIGDVVALRSRLNWFTPTPPQVART